MQAHTPCTLHDFCHYFEVMRMQQVAPHSACIVYSLYVLCHDDHYLQQARAGAVNIVYSIPRCGQYRRGKTKARFINIVIVLSLTIQDT